MKRKEDKENKSSNPVDTRHRRRVSTGKLGN